MDTLYIATQDTQANDYADTLPYNLTFPLLPVAVS